MSIKSTTRKTAGLFAILLSAGLMQAQTASPTGAQAPVTDQNKAQWIQSNPDAYRAMGGQVNTSSDRVNERQRPADAISEAPAAISEKKEVGTAMPWGAPANKEAWIAAHPQEYNAMTGNTTTVMPWGDAANKAAWKAAHPAEFEAINNGNATPVTTTNSTINH